MEPKPRVEARPPALIEAAVRLLVPPAAREHVLGDLSERYVSPPQYLADAVRTIPFVLKSQIRRTSYFSMWPLVGGMLMVGFTIGTPSWGPHSLIPSVATLVGFMFRDAYRVQDLQRPWRQGLVDLLIVAATVLATESIVALTRPEWLIGRPGMAGGAIVLIVLYLLRGRNPNRRPPHFEPAYGSTMTLDQLRSEVSVYNQYVQRAMQIEITIAAVLIPVFVVFAVVAELISELLGRDLGHNG